jgi:hypothetical protein
MNAARFPSGDIEVTAAAPPRPLRPRPRPLAAAADAVVGVQAGTLHDSFVPAAGLTSTATFPVAVVTRYQNRSSASQVGLTPDRKTRGVVFQVMNFSAWA